MPIEVSGKRDPALAAAIKAGKPPESSLMEYVVGRRPLKVGDETRQPGDPIPEAESWPRLESWLHTGAVVAVPAATPRRLRQPEIQRKAAQVRPQRPGPQQTTEPPARPVLRPRKGASA